MSRLTISGDARAEQYQEAYRRALGKNPQDGSGFDNNITGDNTSWDDEMMPDVSSTSNQGAPESMSTRPGLIPTVKATDNYPNAATGYGAGHTVMDDFKNDKFSGHRVFNLYYPFASKDEWLVGVFLLRSSMTVTELDAFFKLPLISKLGLSFSSAKELRGRAELLPPGPQWKCQPIDEPSYPTKTPIRLFYRDALECVQFLFGNPLLAGHINLTPQKLWSDPARQPEHRIYRQWMTSDTAWNMQSKIPSGATLLGTVISSDKTNISVLTGDRVAHPLLLSLANIDEDVRTKATSHAFQLLALFPCVKFICPKNIRGVLESRLYHHCADFVLRPLKMAALFGIMLSDPYGMQRFCFTPLASDVVDTPEAALVSCVSGKTSHVTLAFHKHFADSFRHPTRDGRTTLLNIAEVASRIDPERRVEDFMKECKKLYRLNGVHKPFWRDWNLSDDPARFLTPEPLHHWHKQFFDHDLHWARRIVGDDEIDFRFSVLPIKVGYRHFGEGISKLKQCTGREHREMERHLIVIIADAAPKDTVRAIRALMDFRQVGQALTFDAGRTQALVTALEEFHRFKHALLAAGARPSKRAPNWFIPKLEFMHSVATSIPESGAPMQWSADPTEKLHSVLIKQPARERTNNRDYDPQIIRHLDRDGRLTHFELLTSLVECGINLETRMFIADAESADGPDLAPTSSQPIRNLFLDAKSSKTLHSDRIFASSTTAFSLNYSPATTAMLIQDAQQLFSLPDFTLALTEFFSYDDHVLGGRRRPPKRPLPCSHIRVWHTLHIQSQPLDPQSSLRPPFTAHASPPTESFPFGRYDTVLVYMDEHTAWPPNEMLLSGIHHSSHKQDFLTIEQDIQQFKCAYFSDQSSSITMGLKKAPIWFMCSGSTRSPQFQISPPECIFFGALNGRMAHEQVGYCQCG
ncbi:hypothetical protein BDZ89DRAFT_1132820 [Hymenopellis radicata]|nr:hypothetical protein BDZ89DRAFT_1132820 [Hymenopellis radicata]